uniref:Fibronectin type III-like domain-containing protein n=2 Tax=Brassica oleracea TaxID=3712 RepID=A0A0D3AX32_BRAOL
MHLHVEVSNTGEFDETHTVFAFAEQPENGIKGLGVNKQLVAFHVTAGGQNAPFKSILRLASILV